MVTHKDMPTGSRQWAGSVDKVVDKVSQLEAIVQRVTKDLRLDFSDPNRQYNSGSVPSVQKPVQMKMSSMHDIEVPNVQDGDVLTWDGLKGRWVAGRYDGPAKPTDHGQGRGVHPDDPIDPDEPDEPDVPDEPEPEPNLVLANTFSEQYTWHNMFDDPDFSSTQTGLRSHPNYSRPMTYSLDENASYTDDTILTAGGQSTFSVTSTGEVTHGYCGLIADWIMVTDEDRAANKYEKSYLPYIMVETSTGANDLANGWESDLWVRQIVTYYNSAGEVTYSRPGRFEPLVVGQPKIVGLPDFYGVQGSAAVPAVRAELMLDVQTWAPWTKNQQFTITHGILGSPPEDEVLFDGDTPDNPPLYYDWEGTPGSSTSIAVSRDQIKAPNVVIPGNLHQVIGHDFPPSGPVWIGISNGNEIETVADANGSFEYHFPVPEGYTTTYTNPSIYAYGNEYGWGEVYFTVQGS